jgi:hypothetical protein
MNFPTLVYIFSPKYVAAAIFGRSCALNMLTAQNNRRSKYYLQNTEGYQTDFMFTRAVSASGHINWRPHFLKDLWRSKKSASTARRNPGIMISLSVVQLVLSCCWINVLKQLKIS